MSKTLPAQVQQFLKGTPYDTHRDQSSPFASGSSASSSSFRQTTQTGTNFAQDEDLGRFAAGPSSHFSDGFSQYAMNGKGKQVDSPQVQPHPQDGGDIQALLSFASLTDEVHGDWETDLLTSQQSQFQQDLTLRLPQDPQPTSRSSLKGKGRSNSGNHSPTSTALLSSLNSLDIASMRYLSSLLAKDETEAIQDYLSQGSYTDDVWAVPAGAKEFLQKVKEGTEEESGKEKALKRLRMIMRHMRGEETDSPSPSPSTFATLSHPIATTAPPTALNGFESPWENEYAILSQHSSSSRPRTRHSTDSSLATTPTRPISQEHEADAAASSYNAPLYEASKRYLEERVEEGRALPLTETEQAQATAFELAKWQKEMMNRGLQSYEEVEALSSGFSSSSIPASAPVASRTQDFHQPPPIPSRREERREKEGEENGMPPFQEFMMQRLATMRKKSFDGKTTEAGSGMGDGQGEGEGK